MTAKQNKRQQLADQIAKWFGPNSTTRKMNRNNKEVEMRKREQFRKARNGNAD